MGKLCIGVGVKIGGKGYREGVGSMLTLRAEQWPNIGCLRKTLHQRGVMARGLGSTINTT